MTASASTLMCYEFMQCATYHIYIKYPKLLYDFSVKQFKMFRPLHLYYKLLIILSCCQVPLPEGK